MSTKTKNRTQEEAPSLTGLMSVPLVRQAFSDPSIPVVTRAIDKDWTYTKVTSFTITGFNPYQRELYIPAHSAIASWLAAGKKDDRKFNESDFLATEVFFLVHDHLHAWSAMVIQSEMPELEFGHGEITTASIETFAFCHILTEAVATIGLDYWYLSTLDVDRVCNIGTSLRSLTCAYSEGDLSEYRQFNSGFEVQTPSFFHLLAEFYCTGEFDGFSSDDLKRSPKLLSWLQHELTYGETQRAYIRNWLCHLSNGNVSLPQSELNKPFSIRHKWQKKLIKTLGQMLWRKVKQNEPLPMRPAFPVRRAWRRRGKDTPDFRFTNLNTLETIDDGILRDSARIETNYPYFYAQWISAHEFMKFPKEELALLRYIAEKRDVKSLLYLFRKNKVPRVPKSAHHEPADIFFPN